MFYFILLLYHFFWTVPMLLALPLAWCMRDPRRRKRVGFHLAGDPLSSGSIWVHALSVGEVVSALPLVRALRKQCPDRGLAFTTATLQGMQIAQKELAEEVDRIEYMPLDFWWAVHRLVRTLQPAMFILVETDLWPGLLFYLKKKNVKTVLINGRISPRTDQSYRKVKFFIRGLFDSFDLVLMQTPPDRERLLHIGLPSAKVRANGNIKFDRAWQVPDGDAVRSRKTQLGWKSEDPIWVAGSTHPGEETLILDAFGRLRQSFPGLRLILAPRRIERSPEITQQARAMHWQPLLKTTCSSPLADYDILVLDTIGDLEKMYALAEIAFVGGSLVPVGGHNLLEPASFAKPVLFGPYTHNFQIMAEALLAAGGGRRIRDAAELQQTMLDLLSNPMDRSQMGIRALNFVKKNSGALARSLVQIKTLLQTG